MSKKNETNKKETGKKKKLKHVKVYDRIYEKIQKGIYPPGTQLPSENALAEEMGVSRMTLRKALTLFSEDGIIKNIPGVGHFVCTPEDAHKNILDMSKIKHPIHAYSATTPDDVEFSFRIEPPTPSILDTLKRYTPAVVITDRWYKSKKNVFAYSLSFIPIECIAENQLDLNNPDRLLSYLENECYDRMSACRRIFTHSTSGNFTAERYALSNTDSFLLIQETLYDEDKKIIMSGKHYIPSDMYRIEINF